MTQIRSLKKLLSDTQTSPFEFALIFKVRSMIVERRVMIPWKPIDMSFSNPFGDQVLHLYIYIYIYIYSVTVSTTQKGTFHFGSNIDLPLVSWLPSNSKSPSFNYENQFHSLFSSSFLGSRLLHFPLHFSWSLLVISRISSGFILVFLSLSLAESSITWMCLYAFVPKKKVTRASPPNKMYLGLFTALWIKGKSLCHCRHGHR